MRFANEYPDYRTIFWPLPGLVGLDTKTATVDEISAWTNKISKGLSAKELQMVEYSANFEGFRLKISRIDEGSWTPRDSKALAKLAKAWKAIFDDTAQ